MKRQRDRDTSSASPHITAYFTHPEVTLYAGEPASVLTRLPEASASCIVTSPPAYRWRKDLQDRPQSYIDRLVTTFHQAKRVLCSRGTLWVHLIDSYWTQGSHRIRQESSANWLQPKQQLLLPYRLAVAMQDDEWLVRMDVIWRRTSPISGWARDRCNVVGEHIFQFAKQRAYYFDMAAVSIPSHGKNQTKPPPSVWFAELDGQEGQFARRPVLAGCPKGGIILDPFCQNGDVLAVALKLGRRAIGIEENEHAITIVQARLEPLVGNQSHGGANGYL